MIALLLVSGYVVAAVVAMVLMVKFDFPVEWDTEPLAMLGFLGFCWPALLIFAVANGVLVGLGWCARSLAKKL